MGVLLSEKMHRKSSGRRKHQGVPCVDRRETPMNRDKKKNDRSKSRRGIPSQGVPNFGGVVKMGIFRGAASIRRMEKVKAKRRIFVLMECRRDDPRAKTELSGGSIDL